MFWDLVSTRSIDIDGEKQQDTKTIACRPNSCAQSNSCCFTFAMDKDFPVPGHPHMYKLPALSFWMHPLQKSRTLFCSFSRQTTVQGKVETCNASLTALIWWESVKIGKLLLVHIQQVNKLAILRGYGSFLTFGVPFWLGHKISRQVLHCW